MIKHAFFYLLIAGFIASCSDRVELNVDTYTISRSGVFYPDERFDVVHVYGFADNREVAQQIANFLNKDEPGTYQIRKHDHE